MKTKIKPKDIKEGDIVAKLSKNKKGFITDTTDGEKYTPKGYFIISKIIKCDTTDIYNLDGGFGYSTGEPKEQLDRHYMLLPIGITTKKIRDKIKELEDLRDNTIINGKWKDAEFSGQIQILKQLIGEEE